MIVVWLDPIPPNHPPPTHFNALFRADGDQRAKTYLDTRHTVCKFGMVRHLLKTYLMTQNRPPSIDYIELRFLRSDVAVCVAHTTAKILLPSDYRFSVRGLSTVLKWPRP